MSVLAVLVGAAGLFAAAWSYALWVRPYVFLRNGHWTQARRAAELLERSFIRALPGVRGTAAYVRALTLHLEGDFAGSRAALAAVRDRPAWRQAALLIDAGNLLLAGEDADAARDAAAEACKMHAPQPEDLLLLANAELARGSYDGARNAFARVPRERPARAPWPAINEPVFRYLRALYLSRTEGGDPRPDLTAAAHAPLRSVYVDRARALLALYAAAPEEAPSSIGALVIDE